MSALSRQLYCLWICGTTLFKIPSSGFVGFEPINRGPNFRVSTIERAIIDCIDRPQLCGGISDLPEILYRAKNQVDVERVIEYLPTYDSKSLICKVACLLEKSGYRLSATQEEKLQKQSAGVKTYLFPPGRAATSRVVEYSQKWRVLINADGFQEKANTSWHQMRLIDAEKKKMQESYQKTLDKLTKYYLTSDQFNGLRGDRLALEAEMDATMARIIFRDLCSDGLVDIVSSRAFINPYIKADRTVPKDVQLEDIERELTSFCVYPSPKHLAKAVKKSRFPHYKSELATGCGQLDIRYFDNKVLEHYLAHPEKYIVNENPFGMGQHHAAFKDVPKRQWNKVWGAVKCPGVRQLANGGRAICMTLRYLSQMPRDEQVHWAQFELPPEQCHFLPDSVDEVFTKWYYGRVRSKPAWEGTSHEDDDHDD